VKVTWPWYACPSHLPMLVFPPRKGAEKRVTLSFRSVTKRRCTHRPRTIPHTESIACMKSIEVHMIWYIIYNLGKNGFSVTKRSMVWKNEFQELLVCDFQTLLPVCYQPTHHHPAQLNRNTSSPHDHHPAVRLRANTSRAEYSQTRLRSPCSPFRWASPAAREKKIRSISSLKLGLRE